MTQEKKNKFWKWLLPSITPTLVVTGIVLGALAFAEMELRLFSSPEIRIEAEKHVAEPYNPVTNFQRADTLNKRSDTLIRQQENVVKLIDAQNKLLENIAREKAFDDSIVVAKERAVQKSRAQRDSINKEILKKLKDIEVKQVAMEQKLDTIQ